MVAVAYDALLDLWYDIQTVIKIFNNSTVIARARVPGVAALCGGDARSIHTLELVHIMAGDSSFGGKCEPSFWRETSGLLIHSSYEQHHVSPNYLYLLE
jgi:hypothetical protein